MSSESENTSGRVDTTSADKNISVRIGSSKLTAMVEVSPPADGEAAVTFDDIKTALADQKIVFGIDDEKINQLIAESQFGKPVTVAEGLEPVSGTDASLEFKFNTVHELKPSVDPDGRIDYKDINFIQRAVAGQVLVIKNPAIAGTPGKDVLGRDIPVKPARDINLPQGNNTEISKDGLQLLAACDGSIVYASKAVNINEIHVIGGNVCAETGNITHNGSLVIRGKVESNFVVQARGNIEIAKSVADAKIFSGGNIMIKGGVQGARNGVVEAAGNVTCKYVNDQNIRSGNDITVGGEVLNSFLRARTNVILVGRRGRIVGGKVQAGELIRANCLGSEAGTKTELQVAYDANLMKGYGEVIEQIETLEENLTRVNEGLYVFYKMQLSGKLRQKQEEALTRLESFKKNYPAQKKELEKQKAKLEAEIQLNQQARIIATERVFPGVFLQFGIVYKEITDPMGACVFHLADGKVVFDPYTKNSDHFNQA